jgi:hypothetical protein
MHVLRCMERCRSLRCMGRRVPGAAHVPASGSYSARPSCRPSGDRRWPIHNACCAGPAPAGSVAASCCCSSALLSCRCLVHRYCFAMLRPTAAHAAHARGAQNSTHQSECGAGSQHSGQASSSCCGLLGQLLALLCLALHGACMQKQTAFRPMQPMRDGSQAQHSESTHRAPPRASRHELRKQGMKRQPRRLKLRSYSAISMIAYPEWPWPPGGLLPSVQLPFCLVQRL